MATDKDELKGIMGTANGFVSNNENTSSISSGIDNFNDLYNNGNKTNYSSGYKLDPMYTENNSGFIKRNGEKISIQAGQNKINGSDLRATLRSNGIFSKKSIANNQYIKFNRFGYTDPYNTVTSTKELLFFTKPDLNIFGEDDVLLNISATQSESSLNPAIQNSTLFTFALESYFPVLKQLQYSADKSTPFMCILSNRVTSPLELPGISAEQIESSANAYGTTISYRGHSIKSDQAHSFSLSFKDSSYLEVYMLAKLYDEYHKLVKLGRAQPKKQYIINRILDDQFSIYKFILADDGETILYWAKVTGVFITDVPRSDFSEFPEGEVKFSLSFYGQFVKDMDVTILSEFNAVSSLMSDKTEPIDTFDVTRGLVDNRWVARPYITKDTSSRRSGNKLGDTVYKMKWYN